MDHYWLQNIFHRSTTPNAVTNIISGKPACEQARRNQQTQVQFTSYYIKFARLITDYSIMYVFNC